MHGVARDGPAQLPAVPHVDRDHRRRPLARPVQHEVTLHLSRDLRVRVEDDPEVATVRAAQLLVQPSEQPQRQDREPAPRRLSLRRLHLGVPVEARGVPVALAAHRVDRRAQPVEPFAVASPQALHVLPVRVEQGAETCRPLRAQLPPRLGIARRGHCRRPELRGGRSVPLRARRVPRERRQHRPQNPDRDRCSSKSHAGLPRSAWAAWPTGSVKLRSKPEWVAHREALPRERRQPRRHRGALHARDDLGRPVARDGRALHRAVAPAEGEAHRGGPVPPR